jgi:hypothetical protein
VTTTRRPAGLELTVTRLSWPLALLTKSVVEEGEERAVPLSQAELDGEAAQIAYQQQEQACAASRNSFVHARIKQGALAMQADALDLSKANLEPLSVGAIVRVSESHLNTSLRAALKMGVKRAKDRVAWSEALYYVDAVPLHHPTDARCNSQWHARQAAVPRAGGENCGGGDSRRHRACVRATAGPGPRCE